MSNPIAVIWFSREAFVCSSEMYSAFAPAAFALFTRIAYAREDFIVPGSPVRRTTDPFGTPPPSTSSNPSIQLFTGSSSIVAHLLSARFRISSTLRAALWRAIRTRPRFASRYASAITRAWSPAPVDTSLPWSDSIRACSNRPCPSWTVAISDVPTIAAVIAAVVFGSTPSGRLCVMIRPSRRTTAAARMSETAVRLRITSSSSDQVSATSPHPHDHLREDLQGLPHPLPLRRDREHHGRGLRGLHPRPDRVFRHRAGEVGLVREDHARHVLPDEVEHLPRPWELLRAGRVDHEEEAA